MTGNRPEASSLADVPGVEPVLLSRRPAFWDAVVISSFVAISVIFVALVAAAVPNSLGPALPPNAQPLGILQWGARGLGLTSLTGSGKAAVAFASVLLSSAAFAVALIASWRGRLSVRTAVVVGIALEGFALAMPLLFSHDVYHYAMYGRMVSIHHANPYELSLSRFPDDPFYRYVSPPWRHTPALYGPAFVEVAALITRALRSPAGVIVAFKALSAGAAIATTVLVASLASRLAPARAAFAVVLLSWNPVTVLYVVAPGHMDSILALLVISAFWLLAPSRRNAGGTGPVPRPRELLGVALLALATAMKVPVGAVLALAVALIAARAPGGRRLHRSAVAIFVAALVFGMFALPFVLGGDPTLAMTRLNDYGGYSAPSAVVGVLLGLPARIVGGASAARLTILAVRSAFTLAVAAVMVMGLRATLGKGKTWSPTEVGASWAWVLLLIVLMAPIFWPWYFVWLVPVAWMLPTPARWSLVAISAVFPLFVTVGEPGVAPAAYTITKAASLGVLAPALLLLLVYLGRTFASRIFRGVPLDDTVTEGSSVAP